MSLQRLIASNASNAEGLSSVEPTQPPSNDSDSGQPSRMAELIQNRSLFISQSQKKLSQFLAQNPHLQGLEFVEQVLQHFEFSFQTSWHEKERIPTEGRLVIVANHPLGALDAAAVFRLIRDVREDVKVVVDQAVHSNESLKDITLPNNVPILKEYLDSDGALIIFPSDEISRIRPAGVIDTKWKKDFLKLASEMSAPVLPVYIDASNSALFYGISAIYKPLSSLMLVPEMYKQTRKTVALRVGHLVTHETFAKSALPLKTQVKLFKKHLYKIGRGKKGIWPTQSPVAHPESRQALKQLISSQDRLGETSDHKQIFLYKNQGSCAVLREIGRLREIAFRAVGEGTGARRDIDRYDASYSQLVLWDDNELEMVGAYRIANAKEIIASQGVEGLYSASLFDYDPSIMPMLAQGAELGRSFVQPKYWGKRSLDYLWYGIGSYLSQNPQVKYLFGPVSISNDLPKAAKDLLVYFFTLYFGSFDEHKALPSATSKHPYLLSNDLLDSLSTNFSGTHYKEDFIVLKNIMSNMGCSVPTLYKQYSDLCEPGGLRFLGFGVDPSFGDCIDGLVMVEVSKIKQKKRKRYIPDLAGDA
jgi:putative hemolysin